MYTDGRVGHSAKHQGTAGLHGLNAADRVLPVCKATMAGDPMMNEANPEVSGAELQFCMIVAAP